jgi:hypothetical protein
MRPRRARRSSGALHRAAVAAHRIEISAALSGARQVAIDPSGNARDM